MRNKELLIKDLKVINSCTDGELEEAAEYLLKVYPNAVDNYLHDDTNTGLAYHICGYDGKCQQKFIEDFMFTHNVNVF